MMARESASDSSLDPFMVDLRWGRRLERDRAVGPTLLRVKQDFFAFFAFSSFLGMTDTLMRSKADMERGDEGGFLSMNKGMAPS